MNLPAWTGTCAKLDESFTQKGKIFDYVKIENKTKFMFGAVLGSCGEIFNK